MMKFKHFPHHQNLGKNATLTTSIQCYTGGPSHSDKARKNMLAEEKKTAYLWLTGLFM